MEGSFQYSSWKDLGDQYFFKGIVERRKFRSEFARPKYETPDYCSQVNDLPASGATKNLFWKQVR